MLHRLLFPVAILLFMPAVQKAAELKIAVASNFHQTLESLASAYQQRHPETSFALTPGSSGKLFAQISNGAKFHAFFSADESRPKELELAGTGLPNTRFTYALGRLALWQPNVAMPDLAKAKTIAIANPELAPYGQAASVFLQSQDFPNGPPRLVQGTNISQAFNFAHSGAADTAFVALSQLRQQGIDPREYSIIDAARHDPIVQQAIALVGDPELKRFLTFIRSEFASGVLDEAGYLKPTSEHP